MRLNTIIVPSWVLFFASYTCLLLFTTSNKHNKIISTMEHQKMLSLLNETSVILDLWPENGIFKTINQMEIMM